MLIPWDSRQSDAQGIIQALISLIVVKNSSESSASGQLIVKLISSLHHCKVRPQREISIQLSQGSVSRIKDQCVTASRGSSQKVFSVRGPCTHSEFRSLSHRHCIISQNQISGTIWFCLSSFHSLSRILGSPLLSLSSSRFTLVFDKDNGLLDRNHFVSGEIWKQTLNTKSIFSNFSRAPSISQQKSRDIPPRSPVSSLITGGARMRQIVHSESYKNRVMDSKWSIQQKSFTMSQTNTAKAVAPPKQHFSETNTAPTATPFSIQSLWIVLTCVAIPKRVTEQVVWCWLPLTRPGWATYSNF